MPRAVPSSSRRERRSSQLTAPGQAIQSPTVVSSHTRLAGLIMHFPRRNELENPPGNNLQFCYNHPCVVLSPVAVDGVVTVLPMTSFNSRHLHVRYPKHCQAADRAHYLPVAPAPAHPDTAALLPPLLLHLTDPAPTAMAKDSYVNTERLYPGIPLAFLRPFHGRHGGSGMVLDAASYQLVVERAGFVPPPPPPPPPPSTGLLDVSIGPARRNPPPVPLLDQGGCSIDVDRLRQKSRPVHHPPPSYGTVPASRPRSPVRPAARGGREAPLGCYPDSAAGGARLLPAGFVAGLFKCVLCASVLFLVAYGGYLAVVKTVEGARLVWASVRNGVGVVADAVRGVFRGAGDGVRGAWESVVGWVRRVVGFLRF